MNPIRRLLESIVGLLPVPDAISDSRRPIDPKVDPEALEAFGERQLAQFGPGQQHLGGAPLPTHYVIEGARDARKELERQADSGGSDSGDTAPDDSAAPEADVAPADSTAPADVAPADIAPAAADPRA